MSTEVILKNTQAGTKRKYKENFTLIKSDTFGAKRIKPLMKTTQLPEFCEKDQDCFICADIKPAAIVECAGIHEKYLDFNTKQAVNSA